MSISMFKKVSPVGILLGLLVSQAVSAIGAFALIVLLLVVHGNEVLVAFFEYPSSILTTMLLSLLSFFIGGYCSMLSSKKALVNPLILGFLTVALNVWLMYLIDFKYGGNYFWMLVITIILIVPFTLFGGYVYQNRNS